MSFKTCRSINEINEIVQDIDLQTHDELEMSKRISAQRNDKAEGFDSIKNWNLSPQMNKQDTLQSANSPAFKFINPDDIDFDQVDDLKQSPMFKHSPQHSQSINTLKSKYNQPAVITSDNFDNISEIQYSKPS